MKLATTLGDFRGYCDTYEERVKHVCEAGFLYLDLDLYTADKDDALLVRDNWKENAKSLKSYAESLGATFIQAHSPGGCSRREPSTSQGILYSGTQCYPCR